jgi:hypothetical protein
MFVFGVRAYSCSRTVDKFAISTVVGKSFGRGGGCSEEVAVSGFLLK